MSIFQEEIKLQSSTQFELIDITKEAQETLVKSKIKSGILVVFSPHSTAAIRINQNEPLLKQDIMKMIYRTIPVDINYAHDFFEIRSKVSANERSNGHAHVKDFLLGQSETVPVEKGKMLLGERQSIFFVELDGARERRAIIKILGE
jgi:secondary thiamine-phosphate synthase enzyme